MKVRELIELNQMITDVQITVRKGGTALLDQLNIGSAEGEKPPYPLMVPKEERYIGNMSIETKREAHYINKSINAWDDGKDYWQVKVNRIPKQWLDLEVYSWGVSPASTVCYSSPRRRNGNMKNVNFHGQRIDITAIPSGECLEVKEVKQTEPEPDQVDGQMSIEDWDYEVMKI